MKLYSYQKAHVDRLVKILQTKRGALDLSATGTGKTITALSVCKKLGVAARVIAPLSVLPAWERTAQLLRVPIYHLNYEMVSKNYAELYTSVMRPKRPDPLIIYDEAHRCKNHKTQNAKNMLTHFAREGYKILALSATIANHAEHLRAWNEAFNFCNEPSFSGFMRRCGYTWIANRWSGQWVPGPSALQRTSAVLKPFSSSMTLADAAALFKKNSVNVEVISTREDAELKALYKTALREKKGASAKNHLVDMLRARQASERIKCDYAVESIESLIEEGFSVVVFCNFTETVKILQERLWDFKPAVIQGGQNPSNREDERKRFQSNETSVILCNIQSGGVGLDLHDIDGRPRRSIIFPSWSAVDLKQALGRIHRAGAKSASVQTVLYSDVSVERRMAELVREKMHALDTLHDSEILSCFEETEKWE